MKTQIPNWLEKKLKFLVTPNNKETEQLQVKCKPVIKNIFRK